MVGKGNLRLIRDKAHRRPCDPMRPGSSYHADLIPVRKLRLGESSGHQAIGCLLDLDTSIEIKSLLLSFSYPFTAPIMTPFTKKRCRKGYTHRIGTVDTTIVAYFRFSA